MSNETMLPWPSASGPGAEAAGKVTEAPPSPHRFSRPGGDKHGRHDDTHDALSESASARVLAVVGDEYTRDVLARLLSEEDYSVEMVSRAQDGLEALQRRLFHLVVFDVDCPDTYGPGLLVAGRGLQPDAQFLVIAGTGSVESAVEAIRLGAFHYLTKPLRAAELRVVLARASDEVRRHRELARLRRRADPGFLAGIVGRSPELERALDLVERVAPTRATVLITGETGTGKELVARAVHELSERSRRAFVPIHCASLPETLLEAELFGHTKGSFTGAISGRRGLFEEADGGTVFLDEVGTIPPGVQAKLLRVLQEKTIHRIGSNTPVPVDFRLVAATNVDLAAEVRAERFREDLFFRLNVFPIRVPPLRERPGDIPLLADFFCQRFAREHGIDPPQIPDAVLERMLQYSWPGNVRELENRIERAVILSAGGGSLWLDVPRGDGASAEGAIVSRALEERWELARLEREYILQVVECAEGKRREAAAVLGIDRRTLDRKLKEYRRKQAPGSTPTIHGHLAAV